MSFAVHALEYTEALRTCIVGVLNADVKLLQASALAQPRVTCDDGHARHKYHKTQISTGGSKRLQAANP